MNQYKMFRVTVQIMTYNDKIWHEVKFNIKAQSAEEAEAIVHNRMVFSHEPKFNIADVKEVEA